MTVIESSKKNLTIRSLTPADEQFLAEMVYQAIFVPEGGKPPARDILQQSEISKYFRDFGRPGESGYVAFEEHTRRPVGAAWLRLFKADDKGYGYVDEATPELTIAVLPAYRGRGAGTMLLEYLLSRAQRLYPAISLSVWPENPAYRLYQRLGFVGVEEHGPAVTMLKRFKPGE